MEITPCKDYTPSLHEVVDIGAYEESTTKLYEAALRGCTATLNSLVQKDPLILNKVSLTSFSETPLHISALLGHLDFTKALLSQKPKLTTELDSFSRSPLHLASAECHIEIVKALLQANSDVCLVHDQDGRIPLHFAVMRGRIEVIRNLFSARPESIRELLDGDTVLHLCVRYNHLEALRLLVTLVDDDFLNSRNQEGNTILHSAVMLKQLKTIKFLYSLSGVKARANALNGIGFTTLDVLEHGPRDFKSLEIRDILMEAGVRRAKDLDTVTPPSPPIVVVNTEARPTKSRCSKWMMKYFSYQGKWLEETQGTLMLVATVIATVTFQAATNPPGGVWQEDIKNGSSTCTQQNPCNAGTAVLAYASQDAYLQFVKWDVHSFVASLGVILLVIGFPTKNKVCIWFLTQITSYSVGSMTFAYIAGMSLVTPSHLSDKVDMIFLSSAYIWLGLLLVFDVIDTIRFLYWLVRKFRWLVRKCRKFTRQTLACLAMKKGPSSI